MNNCRISGVYKTKYLIKYLIKLTDNNNSLPDKGAKNLMRVMCRCGLAILMPTQVLNLYLADLLITHTFNEQCTRSV